MAVKLQYFKGTGLAEFIRYMLHYSKQEFEDIQHDFKDWPIKSVKDSLPFGQLPVYHEGDRMLSQSIAIGRYVAHKANLIPLDIWEQAQLDSAAFSIKDYWTKAIAILVEKDPERLKELKEKFLNETIDFYFTRFEKILDKNNGHFGKKLSWVDFYFVGILEISFVKFEKSVFEKYTNSLALQEEITSLPGVKEYIAARKF